MGEWVNEIPYVAPHQHDAPDGRYGIGSEWKCECGQVLVAWGLSMMGGMIWDEKPDVKAQTKQLMEKIESRQQPIEWSV